MDRYSIDEKVSLLNETGIFIVKKIHFENLTVEDEFGFERIVETKFVVKRRLILVDQIQEKDRVSAQKLKSESKLTSFPEIDLHIENLISNDSQLSPHDIFTIQIQEFKRFANKMIEKKVTKFRVIHGIGEGKLKSEIRSLINLRAGFSIHDDNFVNGKVGASLIEMQVTKVNPF
jgi:hypothetical protein